MAAIYTLLFFILVLIAEVFQDMRFIGAWAGLIGIVLFVHVYRIMHTSP